jgi:hypothetical protein
MLKVLHHLRAVQGLVDERPGAGRVDLGLGRQWSNTGRDQQPQAELQVIHALVIQIAVSGLLLI